MRRLNDARARLIASAIELIYARSYGAVSVDDLCAHAGVHKGSFYHFFPSKRDLLLAALDAQWEQAKQTMLEPAFAPDVPPWRASRVCSPCSPIRAARILPELGACLAAPSATWRRRWGHRTPRFAPRCRRCSPASVPTSKARCARR